MIKSTILCLAICTASSGNVFANVVGSDAQNFNPTTSGLDFVTVQSSETLDPGILNLGLFLNHAVNTLPYFTTSGAAVTQSRTDFNDSFTAVDYNFGLGVMRNWDVGVSFPVLVKQSVDNTSGLGLYTEGLTEIRLNTKYRLFGDDMGGAALVASVNFNRIQNNPFSGSGSGPTKNLELAADTTLGDWAMAFNFGYRWRDRGEPIPNISIEPVPNQYIASLGASYRFSDIDTKFIIEIFTSFIDGAENLNQTDRELSSGELIVGVKHDFSSSIAFHAGGGTELIHGASAPDWRVYTGLNWNLGPLWAKREGIVRQREGLVERISLPGLNFISATANVDPASATTLGQLLNELLDVAEKNKILKITIKGHTDSVGSEQMNLKLSQFRAETVKKYIIDHSDYTEKNCFALGFGESQPIADNGNYQGRAKNRRVEIEISVEE